VRAAALHDLRIARLEREREDEGLEDQGDGAGGPDVDLIRPGADRARLERQSGRADAIPLDPGAGDAGEGSDGGEVLGAQAGLLAARPDPVDLEGDAAKDGKRQRRAKDLPAALTPAAVDGQFPHIRYSAFLYYPGPTPAPPPAWGRVTTGTL
jgi:hypothetical protein